MGDKKNGELRVEEKNSNRDLPEVTEDTVKSTLV